MSSAIVAKALNDTIGTGDFKGINFYLERIADAIGAQYTFETPEDIKKAVQFGLAEKAFPVGTELLINENDAPQPWIVVSHNTFHIPGSPKANTMTLMRKNVAFKSQFTPPQAWYCTVEGLQPGQYSFTVANTYGELTAGQHNFTLTTEILSHNGQVTYEASYGGQVRTYDGPSDTVVNETATVSDGAGGTNLGTLGVGALNTPARILRGSDNYEQSAIRQWLNDDATAAWTAQTIFDRPPTWFNGGVGFLDRFDDDFKAIIVPVEVHCCTNASYEAPGTTKSSKYTLIDRVYLPSAQEIGVAGGMEDDSTKLEYFRGAPVSTKVKYDDFGNAVNWYTRTAVAGTSFNKGEYLIGLSTSGMKAPYKADNNYGICPMITIG